MVYGSCGDPGHLQVAGNSPTAPETTSNGYLTVSEVWVPPGPSIYEE
jgi:hypothetical protein